MMSSSPSSASVPQFPVEMFFFPSVGGGHQIPMIDIARVFAAHGASSTILAAPSAALPFKISISSDQRSGRPIRVHTLHLPKNATAPIFNVSATPYTDTSVLREPLREILLDRKPDCIVLDIFHVWASEVVDEIGVPRVMFSGGACFPAYAGAMMQKHMPDKGITLEFDPFEIPGIPDQILMTQSQFLPDNQTLLVGGNRPQGVGLGKPDGRFGTVVNSFYDLESKYVDLVRKEFGNRAWIVGPVSFCNHDIKNKAVRGMDSSIDEETCLNWLDSKESDSVLYISFGSMIQLNPLQLREMAHGLESSGQNFIWVIRKTSGERSRDGDGLPEGFEERMRESKRGLIIRGWSPQLLILEHPSVGGFMTHCGWNSTLEAISSGVPMITYPLCADQFLNEKLITDLLGIGVKSGSIEWLWKGITELKRPVGREKVEAAVRALMVGGAEAAEMRRKAKELREKAMMAVEEGGSSYADVEALIKELRSRRKN